MIILVSILADLASIARKIAIEKDWVVEICGRDKDMLACKERERERERESASKFCKKDCFLIYQSVNHLSLCFGLCSKIKDRKHLLDLR